MKRICLLLFAAATCVWFLLSLNCSKPLDIEKIAQWGTDTVFVSDTLIFTDTLYVDTLLCGRLSSHRQEIVWMLFNNEGNCGFEFLASAERVRDPQVLIVDIDSEQYLWDLADGLHFAVEQEIGEFAVVRITSEQPHAFGHAVDICLRIASP